MLKREDIKKLNDLFVDIWNKKNFDLIDQIFEPDIYYVFNSNITRGRNPLKKSYEQWRMCLDDLHFRTDHLIIENNLCAHHWSAITKVSGPIENIKVQKENIKYKGISLLKVEQTLKISQVYIYSNLDDILLRESRS